MINRNQIIRRADDDGVPATTVERESTTDQACAVVLSYVCGSWAVRIKTQDFGRQASVSLKPTKTALQCGICGLLRLWVGS